MPSATVTKQIHFSMRNKGRREIVEGPKPVPEVTDVGRVPRVTRLMALAIKIDGLIASGAITDQAERAGARALPDPCDRRTAVQPRDGARRFQRPCRPQGQDARRRRCQ
jgi:hypothetical protein